MEPLVDVSIQIEVLISRIMDLNDCHVTRGRIKLLPSSSWVPRWCWRVCCPRSGFGSWRPKRRRCPEIPGKWRFEWEKLVENHGTSPRKLERKKHIWSLGFLDITIFCMKILESWKIFQQTKWFREPLLGGFKQSCRFHLWLGMIYSQMEVS